MKEIFYVGGWRQYYAEQINKNGITSDAPIDQSPDSLPHYPWERIHI